MVRKTLPLPGLIMDLEGWVQGIPEKSYQEWIHPEEVYLVVMVLAGVEGLVVVWNKWVEVV